jgi:hypothetical protein
LDGLLDGCGIAGLEHFQRLLNLGIHRSGDLNSGSPNASAPEKLSSWPTDFLSNSMLPQGLSRF